MPKFATGATATAWPTWWPGDRTAVDDWTRLRGDEDGAAHT
jgi:hypothetical protein